MIGPGVAQECVETKDGLHIWEDHFYPEVVDPLTDEVLPDGEVGELVFTSLTKQAMPVIRYRTRDLTRLLPGTARPAFRRMAEGHRPHRRHDDRAWGQRLPDRRSRSWCSRIAGLTPHFLCVLTRPGRMDELTVQVEAAREASTADERAAMAAALRKKVKDRVGVTVRVEVLEPHALERSPRQGEADLRPASAARLTPTS